MSLKDKLVACYKILFRGEPCHTLTVGVKFTKCKECECKRLFDACNARHGEVHGDG